MGATQTPSAERDLGLDTEAVTAWIASLGVEHEGTLTFERVGLGQSNLTIDVRDQAGRHWVLRRPPLGHLLASAHDVVREATILSALGDAAVPVPTVLGLCQDERICAAPLLMMDFVDGMVVDRMEVAQSIDEHVRRGISDSMVDALATIHAVDLDATGLAGLASHKPYATRQLKRWSGQWESAKTRDLPALDELTRRLRSAIPIQRETVLVHGDFHIRNVICAPETGTIRAVLDWELCTLGDPLADIGSLLAYWPESTDPPPRHFAASILPGFATRRELATAYLDTTGRDESALDFWHVLGLWKIAIICEGVLRRALDEPLNAAEGGPPDPLYIEQLIDRAFATLANSTV